MSRQSDIMWFQLQNICVKLIVLLTFACRSGLHICMWPHNVAQTMQSSAHILSGTSGFVLHGFPLWSQFQRNRNATFKTIVCFWLRIFLGEGPEYDNADWHAQSRVKWHAFLIWPGSIWLACTEPWPQPHQTTLEWAGTVCEIQAPAPKIITWPHKCSCG